MSPDAEAIAVAASLTVTLRVVRDDLLVLAGGGLAFEDGRDRGRIVVSSVSTGGVYSVMEWTVAAGADDQAGGYGAHRHELMEETFLIRSGTLEFVIGDEACLVSAGDFVRVPAGTRHGYRNVSGVAVDMVVTFVPGGFEELFVTYRTDADLPADRKVGAGFVEDATLLFASSFE